MFKIINLYDINFTTCFKSRKVCIYMRKSPRYRKRGKEIRKLGLESRPVIPAIWQVEGESGMF